MYSNVYDILQVKKDIKQCEHYDSVSAKKLFSINTYTDIVMYIPIKILSARHQYYNYTINHVQYFHHKHICHRHLCHKHFHHITNCSVWFYVFFEKVPIYILCKS